MSADKSMGERDRLVEKHLRLVHTIAHLYSDTTLPYDDKVQEGSLGLLRAAEKFDPERGVKFDTYASWWVKSFITRAIRRNKVVKIPWMAKELRWRAVRATAEYRNSNMGEYPDIEETLDDLSWSPRSRQTIRQVLTSSFAEYSLDETIRRDGGGETYLDLLEDINAPDPDMVVEARLQLRALLGRLNRLPARQRIVIKARLGIDDGREKTLKSIGDKLGVSHQRIEQIEKKVLSTLGIELPIRRRRRKAG
jgi:RNA polymerase sigma factor (sigma-70 family)